VTAPAPSTSRDEALVLVIVLATGVVDIACLLHLEVFTAYLTGSFLLLGAHVAGVGGPVATPLVAIASFAVGAALASRMLARSAAATGTGRAARAIPVVLGVDAALIAVAAALAAATDLRGDGAVHLVVAVRALAMGAQMAVVRHVALPQVALAAGTIATFDLVAGLVGGAPGAPPEGATRRRLGLLAALTAGAAIGAAAGRGHAWVAWAVAAALAAGAAVLAFVARDDPLTGR
jgi:uncharacterized membrane protein YoaK (UPF0700 family)